MRRPPIPTRGRLWRVLLAVLVLVGLGIGDGGHCIDHHTAAVASVAPVSGHVDASAGLPRTVAEDCRLVISAEPATTTGVTHASPPVRFPAGVVGDVAPRPVPRLLTGRPLTAIGVSRT